METLCNFIRLASLCGFCRRHFCAALGLLTISSALWADEFVTTYTPAADGQIEIECICLVPTESALQCSGLKILDAPAGRPRHRWSQGLHAQKGKPIDLSAACHRKRDTTAMGDGLCCSAGANDVSRLFAARVVKAPAKPADGAVQPKN